MVNLVLPSKLFSLVGTACQIDSAHENDMEEVKRNNILEKCVFVFC